MKRLLCLLPVVLALAACGEKEDAVVAKPAVEKLRLVLDYFPNADHAPVYAAQANGDFERAGLEVDIVTPSDPSAPLKLVAAGRADVAITYEPELFLARDKGTEVVGVGALVSQPLTSIMSLGSADIRSVADLDGKTVGTSGIPYQSAYLKTILEGAGIDPARVKQVDVGFNLVPAMLSKKVDATLGAFWNYEGTQLQREKKNPSIIRMERVGVPTYDELVFAVAQKTARERGDVIRRFMQAMQRGAAAVKADPAVGVTPLLEANEELDRGLQTAVVRATLPAFFPTQKGRPFGWQDPEEWRAYGAWLRENGVVENPPSQAVLTNEFLPGEGADPVEEDPGSQGLG